MARSTPLLPAPASGGRFKKIKPFPACGGGFGWGPALRQTRVRAAVLGIVLAGGAAADEAAGTIIANVGCEELGWQVADDDSGFAEAGPALRIIVAGHADPAYPATTGALAIELTVTVLEGDAAGVFGTGPVLVTAQDIHYGPAAAPPYGSAEGGAVSVALEAFAREGDRVRIAGTFAARLVRRDSPGDALAIEGRFDARLKRLGE